MKTECYLVFGPSGVKRSVRNRPTLDRNEFAIKLRLQVPAEFFERIAPVVDLVVESRQVIVPTVIVDGVDQLTHNAD